MSKEAQIRKARTQRCPTSTADFLPLRQNNNSNDISREFAAFLERHRLDPQMLPLFDLVQSLLLQRFLSLPPDSDPGGINVHINIKRFLSSIPMHRNTRAVAQERLADLLHILSAISAGVSEYKGFMATFYIEELKSNDFILSGFFPSYTSRLKKYENYEKFISTPLAMPTTLYHPTGNFSSWAYLSNKWLLIRMIMEPLVSKFTLDEGNIEKYGLITPDAYALKLREGSKKYYLSSNIRFERCIKAPLEFCRFCTVKDMRGGMDYSKIAEIALSPEMRALIINAQMEVDSEGKNADKNKDTKGFQDKLQELRKVGNEDVLITESTKNA